MDISIFNDKSKPPDDGMLSDVLHETYNCWTEIRDYVESLYPAVFAEWNYTGPQHGWSYRMKDKKRTILYFLPREDYFKVAFVFGQKAFDMIMASDLSDFIKNELAAARLYAEGRGIRIDVRGKDILGEIKLLIGFKLYKF